MLLDSNSLAEFYDSDLGQVTRRLIHRRLKAAWPDLRGLRVLGMGFAIPYLRVFSFEAERVAAFLPADFGPIAWPKQGSLTVVGEDDALPFPDAMFDRVVVIHALEVAEAARPLMRQLWRVLAPDGRILLVVPNRTSLWSQLDRSPFANGRPFSRTQLQRMLNDTMFAPERWDTALQLPPLQVRRLVGTGNGWERAGKLLWPRLAGVHVVEASKTMYAIAPPLKVRSLKQSLTPAPNRA